MGLSSSKRNHPTFRVLSKISDLYFFNWQLVDPASGRAARLDLKTKKEMILGETLRIGGCNPVEKNARQIGSFPQEVKTKNVLSCHHLDSHFPFLPTKDCP